MARYDSECTFHPQINLDKKAESHYRESEKILEEIKEKEGKRNSKECKGKKN